MGKQNVVHPHNGPLFGHNKEWSTSIRCDTDESYKQFKKPDSLKKKKKKKQQPDSCKKTNTLYDSIYVKCPEEAKSEAKSRSVVA